MVRESADQDLQGLGRSSLNLRAVYAIYRLCHGILGYLEHTKVTSAGFKRFSVFLDRNLMCAQGRTEKLKSRDGRMEEAVTVLGNIAPGSISEFSDSLLCF